MKERGFGFIGLLLTLAIIGFMVMIMLRYINNPFYLGEGEIDPDLIPPEVNQGGGSRSLGVGAIEKSKDIRDDLNARDEYYKDLIE